MDIVIVEGPQGVGKTTVTNWLREKMLYSNLYRLTGHSDKTAAGLAKSQQMYDNLMNYMYGLQGCNVNMIFDRIFITEEVYCRLGYRDYSFTEHFHKLCKRLDEIDFRVLVINLECRDIDVLGARLAREKKQHLDIRFCVEESLAQQDAYHDLMSGMGRRYANINVVTVDTEQESNWQSILTEILLIGGRK